MTDTDALNEASRIDADNVIDLKSNNNYEVNLSFDVVPKTATINLEQNEQNCRLF